MSVQVLSPDGETFKFVSDVIYASTSNTNLLESGAHLIKMYISNLVLMLRFWNNLHQVPPPNQIIGKSNNLKVLRPCYTVKQSIAIIVSCNCLYHDLCQLHTKSSSMFHAELVYKLFPPKWRILTMNTNHPCWYFANCCWNSAIHHYFFPFSPCFIYVLTM